MGTSDVGFSASQMGDALQPVPLGAGRSAKYVACGPDFSCVVCTNGDLLCFGRCLVPSCPSYHQMLSSPEPFSLYAPALMIVRTSGENGDGQLGIESTNDVGDDPSDSLQRVDLGTNRFCSEEIGVHSMVQGASIEFGL